MLTAENAVYNELTGVLKRKNWDECMRIGLLILGSGRQLYRFHSDAVIERESSITFGRRRGKDGRLRELVIYWPDLNYRDLSRNDKNFIVADSDEALFIRYDSGDNHRRDTGFYLLNRTTSTDTLMSLQTVGEAHQLVVWLLTHGQPGGLF